MRAKRVASVIRLWCSVALAAFVASPGQAAPEPALIPAGTVIDGTVQSNLSSAASRPGDRFSLIEGGGFKSAIRGMFGLRPAALRGAHIEGHVEGVQKAGLGRNASLDLVFDDVVRADGSVLPIRAELLSVLQPQKRRLRNAALILGGGVAGHYLGKRTGVRAGGLAGMAAATAYVIASKTDIAVPRGTVLRLRLTQPTNLAAAAPPAPVSGTQTGSPPMASPVARSVENGTGQALVAEGEFIGNKRSHVYHAPNCRSLPGTQNRVIFHSEQEATQAGYRPDSACVKK